MARKKRLLGLEALEYGSMLLDMGVPMTKVHQALKVDWSYVSTSIVLTADREGHHSATRPEWLAESPTLQETPDNWEFIGVFPDGTWRRVNDHEAPARVGG
jgi:hypothetical protein